jgi:diguanylate cyclase (GGDEF)-like protein
MAILDWVMPEMTGVDVCARVRGLARERYTYILLLTSKNEKEDLIAGMNAGADDYIIKPFDQQELQVRLEAGKRILSLHDALLDAQRKLIRQATYDELTNLFNRRRILEVLQTELARAERERQPVGVVLADVDKFKSVNDTYGHNVGDQVLRETARRMHQSVRSYDAIGRYGGEEFLLVLPGCDLGCAGQQAERLRLAIASATMSISDGLFTAELPITASFGATTLYPGMNTALEPLIKLADEALYEAKRTGRNRVILRHGEMPNGAEAADCAMDSVAR